MQGKGKDETPWQNQTEPPKRKDDPSASLHRGGQANLQFSCSQGNRLEVLFVLLCLRQSHVAQASNYIGIEDDLELVFLLPSSPRW